MMLQRIKLMPDYSCYPLWDRDDGGDVEPWELPLSEATIERLLNWQKIKEKGLVYGCNFKRNWGMSTKLFILVNSSSGW